MLQATQIDLQTLILKAQEHDVRYGYFHEEDLDNQLTCVVLEPGTDTKRLTRQFKLAGS